MGDELYLRKLATLIRYYILRSTSVAGSGHPSSALSAVELMTVLFFKYFRSNLDSPDDLSNDRFILSKGHASPLLYALYAVAGRLSEKDLLAMRTFDSPLEGHPTLRFKYTEAPTGSLGQGLSIGVGIALSQRANAKRVTRDTLIPDTQNTPKVFVLLGDGEISEGAIWEAIQTASYYKLSNLIAMLDVNRLGQSQETMLGHDIEEYADRVISFGWQAITLEDGHDLSKIDSAIQAALKSTNKPTMIIAKTTKGKGVSILEDQEGWHGKTLADDEMKLALKELGHIDKSVRGTVKLPQAQTQSLKVKSQKFSLKVKNIQITNYKKNEQIATRKAFGNALVHLGKVNPDLLVLDGDVQNSTYTEKFAKNFPGRFYQMFIAEQNMVGAALGMAKLGFKPVVASFACFLTRAADQLRMAGLASSDIMFCGSHAGVSIGADGPSQMGLEDIPIFRSILSSTVLYPADAVSTEKLVTLMCQQKGISYIRTTRPETPIIYDSKDDFTIGGSKVFRDPSAPVRLTGSWSAQGDTRDLTSVSRASSNEQVTIVAAGITVHEALKVQQQLKTIEIAVRVIDCYSIKPIDSKTLIKAARETKNIITVEDHYSTGGLGDAVLEALAQEKNVQVYKLAVSKIPKSGKPEELLDYEGISARSIVDTVKQIVSKP